MTLRPMAALGALSLAGVLVLTAGCASGDAEQAAALARQSCLYSVPDVPSPFDPVTADQPVLDELSLVMRERADLAVAAAEKDDRWTPLADAAVAIAAVAELLRGIRASGESVAEQMPPAVWDQAKFASDAFLLECRPLLPAPTTS